MNDKVIIEAVKDGKRELFGQLMDRYQGGIYLMCLRMTGDAFLSQEIVHDSFVEAYLKLEQLLDSTKFESWVKRIALNLFRGWLRKNKMIFMEIPEDYPQIPADEVETDDIHIKMAMGLTNISPSHRLILVLHYFEKFTYEEIARFLEIPPGTVMSRLYRARNELKNRMETIMETTENDINNMDRDNCIKDGIEAEISVLLEMFNDQKDSIEPLRVILERSPERLIQFIGITDNDEILINISILVNRLTARSIQDILKTCFSDDLKASANACKVMLMAINRCEPYYSKNRDSIASFRSYIILDELIRLPVRDQEKVNFLIDILFSCSEKSTFALCMNMLLCYPDYAFPALMQYFMETGYNETPVRQPFILYSISRMYRYFLPELSSMLINTDFRILRLALTGVEAIGNCFQLADTAEYISDTHRLNDIRMGTSAMKWVPILKEEIDEAIFDDIKKKTTLLITHPEPEIREMAIRCLGLLKAEEYASEIRNCLSNDLPSTRITALLALADLNSNDSAGLFIKFAEKGTEEERYTAIEAIGRLKIKESAQLLKKIVQTGTNRLRRAAITALGEMDDIEADKFLKGLLDSDDIQLRKTAARVIYGGKKSAKAGFVTGEKQRLARLRGGRIPFVMNSMDAAIRYAIPEIREYQERELTGLIAGVCEDFSATRRDLVEAGLITRSNGVCELTERGKTIWRVEHFIIERYLKKTV